VERTDAVGWLPDGTVETVRAAVAAMAPELAREPIVMAPRIAGNPPAYSRGTARVGGGFLAKFAWSAQAAVGVERELAILPLLRELAPSIPVPEIVFASRNPLLFITRHVPGVPAGEPYARDTTPSAIPARLADALAALHAPALKELIEHHGVTMGETQPQATTSALRERFAGPIVTGPRAQRVLTWCDWIDDIHSHAAPETTIVHGDLHTHNMVVSDDGEQLLLVADYENVAIGDPHYDFRYLVSVGHDLDWFDDCRRVYQRQTGRQLSVERILAWHILTALGDALWRTELGVPLPGDLTPEGYADDITRRLRELSVTIT
jgi:aminoglycoside phosphotransferase (APT) family kinase protein